jgi:hypothetical protein
MIGGVDHLIPSRLAGALSRLEAGSFAERADVLDRLGRP